MTVRDRPAGLGVAKHMRTLFRVVFVADGREDIVAVKVGGDSAVNTASTPVTGRGGCG